MLEREHADFSGLQLGQKAAREKAFLSNDRCALVPLPQEMVPIRQNGPNTSHTWLRQRGAPESRLALGTGQPVSVH